MGFAVDHAFEHLRGGAAGHVVIDHGGEVMMAGGPKRIGAAELEVRARTVKLGRDFLTYDSPTRADAEMEALEARAGLERHRGGRDVMGLRRLDHLDIALEAR